MNNFKIEDFKFNGAITGKTKPIWDDMIGEEFIKFIENKAKEGK